LKNYYHYDLIINLNKLIYLIILYFIILNLILNVLINNLLNYKFKNNVSKFIIYEKQLKNHDLLLLSSYIEILF
jgi:hypothetical protein